MFSDPNKGYNMRALVEDDSKMIQLEKRRDDGGWKVVEGGGGIEEG